MNYLLLFYIVVLVIIFKLHVFLLIYRRRKAILSYLEKFENAFYTSFDSEKNTASNGLGFIFLRLFFVKIRHWFLHKYFEIYTKICCNWTKIRYFLFYSTYNKIAVYTFQITTFTSAVMHYLQWVTPFTAHLYYINYLVTAKLPLGIYTPT